MGRRGIGARGGACEAARGGARKRKRTVFFALAAGGGEGSRGVAGFGARAGRTTHLPVLVIGPVFFRGPRPGNLRGRLVPGRHPARTERFLDHAQQPLNGCFYLPSTRSARVSVAGVPRALVRAAPCVRSRPGRTRCARPRALRRRRASRSATPRNADPVRAPKPSAAKHPHARVRPLGNLPFRPAHGSADLGQIRWNLQFVTQERKSAKVPRLHLLPRWDGMTDASRRREGGIDAQDATE